MGNEPQYLFLETMQCQGFWVGGREGQADRWTTGAANSQTRWVVSILTRPSSQSHGMTKSTPRQVAEELKAVTVGAKPPVLGGISGLSNVTCLQRGNQDPRCEANWPSTDQSVPQERPQSLKTWPIPPPTLVLFPVRTDLRISKAKRTAFHHIVFTRKASLLCPLYVPLMPELRV